MARVRDVQQPLDVRWTPVLARGAAVGATAFLCGYALLHALHVLSGGPALRVDSLYTYVLAHGVVRVVDETGTLWYGLWVPLHRSLWFASLPALVLVLAGHATSRLQGRYTNLQGRGPLVGAAVAAGYAPAAVLLPLLFEPVGSLSDPARLLGGGWLDPVTTLLGTLLFAGVFGAVGGVGTRSRAAGFAVGAICVPLGVLVLALLVLA